jgi:hypothetical protein
MRFLQERYRSLGEEFGSSGGGGKDLLGEEVRISWGRRLGSPGGGGKDLLEGGCQGS